MRVLLLGGTGRQGRRCIPALLAHGHILTVYVRNSDKLKTMVTPAVIDSLEAIVVGDATDAQGIAKALRKHNVEGIVDVCGNQVLPWREYLLSKIAQAVVDAALIVGKERGEPLRAWITTWPGGLRLSNSEHLLQEYSALKIFGAQHHATAEVVRPIPVSDLKWSLLCVGGMYDAPPISDKIDLLQAPRHHNLDVQSSVLPGWEWGWLGKLPYVGEFFKRFEIWFIVLLQYQVAYEDVADFLGEDLEVSGDLRVGKEVGYKLKKSKST